MQSIYNLRFPIGLNRGDASSGELMTGAVVSLRYVVGGAGVERLPGLYL